MGRNGNSWKDASGNHVSVNNFDKDAFYFAKGVVGRTSGATKTTSST